MDEGQILEKKSLRLVLGKSTNFEELAKDCVGFANARGGKIAIGIEDGDSFPPKSQIIEKELPNRIVKRISELTVNVGCTAKIENSDNGSEYIVISIFHSASTIASTTDGRYYLRVSDNCVPIMPEDLMRLMTDKPSYIWETKVVKSVRKSQVDPDKLERFVKEIKESNRVSDFIKAKSSEELMDHYLMAEDDFLTNLGVLWIGKRNDRAKLLYAPVIQFLKYDTDGNRVKKLVWDDFSQNPKELLEDVWTSVSDWKEGVEVSDGLFRKFIPKYEEEVVRELLTNALVHKPYTARGDIFINLLPHRLEIHNPGLLPIGVNPQNILHKTVRRNEHLAKIFYDLKLMEREGSGYDKVYEVLLGNGKEPPIISEGQDRVSVLVKNKIVKEEVVSFINRVNAEYQLRQKELICLGLIAQNTTLTSSQFSSILNLTEQNAIKDWIGRLPEFDIIKSRGRTKGTSYYINPEILQRAKFGGKTNLKKIEDHRLRELIYQDLSIYSNSSISDINKRIGSEISPRKIKFELDKMCETEDISKTGERRWTRYSINKTS